MSKVTSADEYIEQHPQWKKELTALRNLFLSYPLEETIKWGSPVYTMEGKNLLSIGAFKNHYAIWFFQGGLLAKNTELLVKAQEGKTQAMRQIKFDEGSDIDIKEISKYIEETISHHKQGKKISSSVPKEVIIADDIRKKFKEDNRFKTAFLNLSPGKQREYSEYISQAKKEETRLNRMEKITPLIIAGKGLHDKYKNC